MKLLVELSVAAYTAACRVFPERPPAEKDDVDGCIVRRGRRTGRRI
ncbi:MAG: hypothetical protein QXV68_02255 [Candidatus Caldarchaeum sp.]